MVDMVTGAASVIGFTNDDHHNGHNGYNYGITGKDALFAHSIDQGEQTRDVLSAIADGITAVEKTGAANSLAVEKVGAAGDAIYDDGEEPEVAPAKIEAEPVSGRRRRTAD